MDPLTVIISALTAGAAAAAKDVVAQVIKDGYAGLKALVVRRFGQKGDVEAALEGVEKKPDSQARQGVLKEELEKAGAAQDAEVVRQAQALLALLEQHGLVSGPSYQATLKGSGAIAQGPGAKAVGERGVLVEGDAKGGVIITGDGNVVGDHSRSDVRISTKGEDE